MGQELDAAKQKIAAHARGIAEVLELLPEEGRQQIKALGTLQIIVGRFENKALAQRVYIFREKLPDEKL